MRDDSIPHMRCSFLREIEYLLILNTKLFQRDQLTFFILFFS